MVAPPIISLETLKNIFNKTIYSVTTPVTVDSDTDVDVGAIHKEDFAKLVIEFQNKGANGAEFTFFGTSIDDGLANVDNAPATPPDFSTGVYRLLTNGTMSLATATNDARSIDDNITWVLIRVRRTTSALDTTVDIFTRGE